MKTLSVHVGVACVGSSRGAIHFCLEKKAMKMNPHVFNKGAAMGSPLDIQENLTTFFHILLSHFG